MKQVLLALAATLGLATAASAATYAVDVTANPFRMPGQPGLQTRAVILAPSGPQNFNGSSLSFDLVNEGDSFTTDLYGLVHYDAPLGADDLLPQASTATLDFAGFVARTVLGTTRAVADLTGEFAIAEFTDTAINIGGGQRILISLADTVFGSESGVFTNGRPGIGFVSATFTLAAVPLPATLPLALGAFGLLGFVARRRKAAAEA